MSGPAKPPHPSETPEYWRRWAHEEREAAERAKRERRNVELIQVHNRNAAEYEAQAAKLEAAQRRQA